MKNLLIIVLVLLISVLVFSYNTHAGNRKLERQKYKVAEHKKGFEIRFYPKSVMASVSSKRKDSGSNANQNFRILAGYIFGGNQQDKKIAMTTPVYMEKDSTSNKMSFVLPAQYQIADLPLPKDSSIKIHYSDEGYFACLSFGGFAGEKKILRKKRELEQLLNKNGYEIIGNFNYLGYNAPWDIINRENDIIVMINYKN